MARAAKKATTPVQSNVITSEVRKGIVLNFEVTDYVAPEHKGGRPKEANPYEAGIAKAIELKGDATKQLTVVIPKADLKAHQRWVRLGMNDKGLSASTVVTEIPGDSENVRLSFRAVDKVKRTRKPKDDAKDGTPSEPAAEPTK